MEKEINMEKEETRRELPYRGRESETPKRKTLLRRIEILLARRNEKEARGEKGRKCARGKTIRACVRRCS